jgi:BirA family transcriptional regulator, biotin operon repressor / biotin---[acetyl-CoA-carboxylase] ligase
VGGTLSGMQTAADPIDPDALLSHGGLATFEHLGEVDSTMERARAIAHDRAIPLPAAVVADRQSLGRGRRGARWWQPPGSLTTSIVLDGAVAGLAPRQAEPRPTWSLACAVALAEAITVLEPSIDPRVRWPNDLESGGRKLAGILVETAPHGRAIFGIGVNTTGSAADAPMTIRHRVATIPDRAGRGLAREPLLVAFLPRLLSLLAEMTADPRVLVDRYAPRCGLTGREVTVFRGVETGRAEGAITGRCLGIDIDGAIVIETLAGRLHLASGSLTHPGDVWHGEDGGTRLA